MSSHLCRQRGGGQPPPADGPLLLCPVLPLLGGRLSRHDHHEGSHRNHLSYLTHSWIFSIVCYLYFYSFQWFLPFYRLLCSYRVLHFHCLVLLLFHLDSHFSVIYTFLRWEKNGNFKGMDQKIVCNHCLLISHYIFMNVSSRSSLVAQFYR